MVGWEEHSDDEESDEPVMILVPLMQFCADILLCIALQMPRDCVNINWTDDSVADPEVSENILQRFVVAY